MPRELRGAVEHAEELLPRDAWPVWTGGNHDNHRFPTRWGDDDPRKARAALVMLMGLRGTPFLYYGDEIGMVDTDVPVERILDPVGKIPRRAHGPRRRAHADAVDGRARRRVHRAPASSRGSPTATTRRATSPTNTTIRIRCSR